MAAMGQTFWASRHRRRMAVVGLAGIAALGAVMVMHWLAPPLHLGAVEQDVVRRWPEIEQMQRPQLERIIEAGADGLVLFDVREADEHGVSRLPGAIRIDPGTTATEFMSAHGDGVKGKGVVFYCSVGVRSSILAARVKVDLDRAGAAKVLNLKGGIFGWHNDARPLVDISGATDQVHGHDAGWGRLVTRQNLVKISQ
jgi:rhodanese-related sulfurtransferase